MNFGTHLQHLFGAIRPLMPHRQCRLCQGLCRGEALCCGCLQQITDRKQRCYRCALPLPELPPNPPSSGAMRICGECLGQPPAFTTTVTAGCYRTPINHWLNNFKERRDLRDGRLLCQLLSARLQPHYAEDDWPEALVPVPLHWQRLLLRGFNQSLWIARDLHRVTRIPVITPLSRRRSRHEQKELSKSARRANLRRAFVVENQSKAMVQGKHLALIDDVVTTTATVRIISQRLLQAGARRGDVWSLARTDKTGFQH